MKKSNYPILDYVIDSCKAKNALEDAKTFLKIAADNCLDLAMLDRVAFLQNDIKDYSGSIKSLEKCLLSQCSADEKFAIRANMAKMLNHLNDPHRSLVYSKLNVEDHFDYDTLMEMSFSYYLMGDYIESEKMMRHLIEQTNLPEDIRGRVEYNIGSYDIEKGDFKKGLRGFVDIGHRIKIWSSRHVPGVPIWNGEDISGKTIIIHAEGGIGDELINVRFVNNLKKLGAFPVWITGNKDLYSVFNRNGIKTELNLEKINLTNSVQCTAMYLPIFLDLDYDQLWDGPYLKPSEEYVTKWKQLLPSGNKLAVKWSGNPFYDQDLHRSIPLKHIQNINYNGTKINLQLEPELYQDDMFNAGQHITNIEDTLAILSLCDNLITSCTSIAHMNGAIGKNGIVCPPIACYYVWLGCDGKSNWYDSSMKVVRQKNHKDWNFVETLI